MACEPKTEGERGSAANEAAPMLVELDPVELDVDPIKLDPVRPFCCLPPCLCSIMYSSIHVI